MKRSIDYRTAPRFRADGFTHYVAGWATREVSAKFSGRLDQMIEDPTVDPRDFDQIGLAGEAFALAATGSFLD